MHNYYRIPDPDRTTHGHRQYYVSSSKPSVNKSGENEYPYGWMDVLVTPNQYVVSRDNNDSNGQLFTEYPGQVRVTSAFFDERIRTSFPTMAALVKNDFPGKKITAGWSLSKHSAPMAQKFADMGVIEPRDGNVPFRQTNNYEFENQSFTSPEGENVRFRNAQRVSDRDILGAKDTLRQTLRPNQGVKRPRSSEKLSPQFEQLKLPGID